MPFRDLGRDAAFFQPGGADRHGAVVAHGGNRDVVALLVQNRLHQLDREVAGVVGDQDGRRERFGDLSRDRDRFQVGQGVVHAGDVLGDDFIAFFLEGLLDRFLDVADGLFLGNNLGQGEEADLHDGVDTGAEAGVHRNLQRVDGVDLDFLADDGFLHFTGERGENLVRRDFSVQQERAAFADAVEHVITADVGGVVTGHEVRRGDGVLRQDRLVAETQVRNGNTTGLLGVVFEIRLYEFVGVVADDFDGVLVGTHGAVGAEAPEHALGQAVLVDDDFFVHRQRQVRYVVVDADGEVRGAFAVEVLVDGVDHGRSELLAGQAVAAADDHDVLAGQSGLDVGVERFAEGAGLFQAVENGNFLHGGRDRFDQGFDGERTVKTDFDQAEFSAFGVQEVDGFFDGFAAGAHGDDDLVRIRGADVIEQVQLAAGLGGDDIHVFLHDAGDGVIQQVGGFAALEVDVGVLGGHLGVGGFRTESAVTETFDMLHIDHFFHFAVVEDFNLLDFVGSTESVEVAEERDVTFERGEVGDKRQVVGFLNRRCGSHGETGAAAGHHIGVVAEDRQRLGGQCAGGHVEHGREHFTGDLVHVRDHQQQALRGGVSGGERACAQRPVHGAGSPGFGLHFGNGDHVAKHIYLTLAGPDVSVLTHR